MIGRHLFDLEVEGDAPIYCPDAGGGAMFIGGVTGGRFQGDRISGDVLPAGGDWARISACGVARLDVKMVLRSDQGDIITMHYAGRMHGPGDTLRRLSMGEAIGSDQYYMRIAPVFETHAAAIAWLDGVVAVGKGEVVAPGKLLYKIFEIE
jgi:Protein of unknown function (DUF3237)